MIRFKKIPFTILLITLQLSIVSLFAQNDSVQEVGGPWHKMEFNVGGYITDITTQARFGSEALGIGIGLDLEKALGLETTSFVFKANGLYRFGKKKNNFVELGYYGIKRKAEKVLATDIEIFDKTYTVGTRITSNAKTNIINLSYGRSFFQTENFDVGVTIGFFVMPISVAIDAIDVNAVTTGGTEGVSFVAPLPVLGLYTNFAFTPKLIMRQSIDFFYIKLGTFKGSLTELNLSLEYNAWKRLGVGLGVNSFNLNFENQKADYPEIDFKGQFGYKLAGITCYIKGYF